MLGRRLEANHRGSGRNRAAVIFLLPGSQRRRPYCIGCRRGCSANAAVRGDDGGCIDLDWANRTVLHRVESVLLWDGEGKSIVQPRVSLRRRRRKPGGGGCPVDCAGQSSVALVVDAGSRCSHRGMFRTVGGFPPRPRRDFRRQTVNRCTSVSCVIGNQPVE